MHSSELRLCTFYAHLRTFPHSRDLSDLRCSTMGTGAKGKPEFGGLVIFFSGFGAMMGLIVIG